MVGKRHILYWILYPLSILYGWGVWVRNYLFENGLLKSKEYQLPIICVGNLAVGGTGKTPHIEYLTSLLRTHLQVAVLSRGYKRKSKGFVLADTRSNASTIGDEPYQLYSKYPDIYIAVDADRCHGIEQLLLIGEKDDRPPVDIILLDDALQHRKVTPGCSIILTDYHRLFTDDALLPYGRLREPAIEKDRAHIVIVTKCPKDMQPFEYRVLKKKLDLRPYQSLFFTTLSYGKKYFLFDSSEHNRFVLRTHTQVLLIVGIAHPELFIAHTTRTLTVVKTMVYADHHAFTATDIVQINEAFETLDTTDKVIITTEKDAARLRNVHGLSQAVKSHLIVQPITIEFLEEGEKPFTDKIIHYVRKNQRNSPMAKR